MPINENAPLNVIPGAIRFNTDSMKLEYYRGGPVGFGTTTTTGEWVQVVTENYDSVGIGTTFAAGSSIGSGTRGVFGGGAISTGAGVNTIDYVNISSTGNSVSFGTLTSSRGGMGGVASNTRGIFAGGYNPSPTPGTRFTAMDKITISSTGNGASFGSLSGGRNAIVSCSNATRGIFAGGYQPTRINVIEYITIASDGNPIDFGDLSQNIRAGGFSGGCASSTRGIIPLGVTSPLGVLNNIEFITISTLGNAADFGDLSIPRGPASCSNSVRGIFAGGVTPSGPGFAIVNNIDYITIAASGNAIDFGDLSGINGNVGSCASPTRGLFVGGTLGPANTNRIEYVTIMSTGNAIDFGDITAASNALENVASISNGHGGLG